MTSLSQYIDQLNGEFVALHTAKEDAFWRSKMGLTSDPAKAQAATASAEIAVNDFSQDATKLVRLRELLASATPTAEELTAAKGWERFFEANVIESAEARKLSAQIVELEGKLLVTRGAMNLGYIDPKTAEFKRATTNELSNTIRIEPDEPTRKAAHAALQSIGPFVLENGYLEIVRKRNELARMCGYEDYYDYKVQRTEGFSKKRLFEILDDLERRTRESTKRTIDAFAAEKGERARRGWNYGFLRSGDISKEFDPYLPFADALERWVRSFAALGIRYRGATLTLDLVDRVGKYENGFMHGPGPSWFEHGKWHSARINFTANAIPDKVGSGNDAINTLFHEGGHAAHFSNVLMNAPCFAQEFAPTSVAYAETQSMFCDSILSDADWLTRYAKNSAGEVIPFELIERQITQMQPHEVIGVRSMLGVCYFEKAIYEMSEADLSAENVLRLVSDLEKRMYFMEEAPRPILAVPHILAGESSAYYHGYVMAEMAVRQTRAFIIKKYGYICDNSNVGPELEEGYWKYGNSISFLDLVERTTGRPFSADALVDFVNASIPDCIADAKREVANAKERPLYDGTLDLDADIRVMHGNELIAEFKNGTFAIANEAFKQWIYSHYPMKKAA